MLSETFSLRGLSQPEVIYFAIMCPRQSMLEGVSEQGQIIPCLITWEMNTCKYTMLPDLEMKVSE